MLKKRSMGSFPPVKFYDGLSAVYDYGQQGVELKNNIKEYWWQFMTRLHGNIVGIDSAIFMHPPSGRFQAMWMPSTINDG